MHGYKAIAQSLYTSVNSDCLPGFSIHTTKVRALCKYILCPFLFLFSLHTVWNQQQNFELQVCWNRISPDIAPSVCVAHSRSLINNVECVDASMALCGITNDLATLILLETQVISSVLLPWTTSDAQPRSCMVYVALCPYGKFLNMQSLGQSTHIVKPWIPAAKWLSRKVILIYIVHRWFRRWKSVSFLHGVNTWVKGKL